MISEGILDRRVDLLHDVLREHEDYPAFDGLEQEPPLVPPEEEP